MNDKSRTENYFSIFVIPVPSLLKINRFGANSIHVILQYLYIYPMQHQLAQTDQMQGNICNVPHNPNSLKKQVPPHHAVHVLAA